jgi:indole-3-glycerol phosphate synthase
MFLKQIVEHKREEIREKQGKRYLSDLKSRIADARATRDFREALERPGERVNHDLPRLIAEIKKASPSKGVMRERFDPTQIAQIYQENGASAISVLTDGHFFQGCLEHLGQVHEKARLPILQKDFILDSIQIYEARAFGADAVLLIAAILEPSQIKEYMELAEELSMDVLVEVHSERELEKVVELAKIVGINNRDLETFETKLETTFQVIREIPDNRIVVSESGIGGPADLRRCADAGVDAVLVGELFMSAEDIGAKVRELLGK